MVGNPEKTKALTETMVAFESFGKAVSPKFPAHNSDRNGLTGFKMFRQSETSDAITPLDDGENS
jgi:hypothetical protein